MKHLLILTMLFAPFVGYAQDSTTTKWEYIELIGIAQTSKAKWKVQINDGDPENQKGDRRIKDSNGKDMIFNSMIHACNMMGEDGWELVGIFTFNPTGLADRFKYVMKRQVRP